MSGLNFDRRTLLKGLLALTTTKVVEEVIPFNRKWFFPKTIPIKYAYPTGRHYDLLVEDDIVGEMSNCNYTDCSNSLVGIKTGVYRGNFAQLLAPGLHQVFISYLKDEQSAKDYFDVISSK